MKYSGSPENERIREGPDTHEAAQAAYPAAEMQCYPVNAIVNSPQSQGAGLIEPLNTSAV